MISIADMKSKFETARMGYGIPNMIIDGVDYIQEFSEYETIKDLLDDYRVSNLGNRLNISIKQVISHYALAKGKMTDEDYDFIKSENDISFEEVQEEIEFLENQQKRFAEKCELYDSVHEELEKMTKISYNITEVSKTKTFIMKDKNTGEKLNLSDILTVFNSLEPNSFIQMIAYCNSEGKVIYKVSTKYPIRFTSELSTVVFEPNTISLFYEISKKTNYTFKHTVLNFENSTCNIEIFLTQYDNTEFLVFKTCKELISFEPNKSFDITTGNIEYHVTGDVSHSLLYENLVLDPLVGYLFRIDERKRPFCINPTDIKVIYYDPMTYCLLAFLGNRSYPDVHITFSEKNNTKGKYIVDFKASNVEIIKPMAEILSHVLSIFTNGAELKSTSYSTKFFTTVYDELKEKTGNLLMTTKSSSTSSYTSSCNAKSQPILISEEEIEDYEAHGRNVKPLENNGHVYYFTCMSDESPFIEFRPVKIDYRSGISVYPCCFNKNEGTTADGINFDSADLTLQNSTRGTTSSIKNYSNTSVLDSGILSDFIKTSFSQSSDSAISLVGTCLFKTGDTQTLNDSFIGALIYATEQYNVYSDTSKKSISTTKLKAAFMDVRRRMIELPYEIYKQELFDVSREQFVANMINPDHYIDPYLYYRGLEELFNVNIFVFTSNIVKANASSFDELKSDKPSLEIPRCYEYHTRTRNKRNIVCIYKNYGSKRSIGSKKSTTVESNVKPSCELIAINVSKDNFLTSVSSLNENYCNSIWNHFYSCCCPISFQKEHALFSTAIHVFRNPFAAFSPHEIAEQMGSNIVGQEINIYGKTTLLVLAQYDEETESYRPFINIQIPGIQPILLNDDIPKPSLNIASSKAISEKTSETIDEEYNGYHFNVRVNGIGERAPLISKRDVLNTFEVTEIDSDGCWIEFLGMSRGIKILCSDDKQLKVQNTRVPDSVEKIINDQNNVSALLQLINWLWRSEYTDDFPVFRDWFPEIVDLQETEYFQNVQGPLKCLNNLYLPKFKTLQERLEFCSEIWPFFFSGGKIMLYDKLFVKIYNLMCLQDFQTRALPYDNHYTKIPTFIVDLIPTDSDFEKDGSLIFTKREHMDKWIKYTNREFYGVTSLTEINIINTHIFEEFCNTVTPYLLRDANGKMYIIQNVSNGRKLSNDDKKHALEIAYQWKMSGNNIGTGQNVLTYPENIKYAMYEVNDSNELVVVYDGTGGSDEYYQIIMYRRGNYAAMLPLL